MLGDLSGVRNFYIVTGYTDMRKSINGLTAIVEGSFKLDVFDGALFVFCNSSRIFNQQASVFRF